MEFALKSGVEQRGIFPAQKRRLTMRYSDDRDHLTVQFETVRCEIPADERARMQQGLEVLGEAVRDFPVSDLRLTCIHHPRSTT
jgi:hypothetical protein